jgi:hypothetical protein
MFVKTFLIALIASVRAYFWSANMDLVFIVNDTEEIDVDTRTLGNRGYAALQKTKVLVGQYAIRLIDIDSTVSFVRTAPPWFNEEYSVPRYVGRVFRPDVRVSANIIQNMNKPSVMYSDKDGNAMKQLMCRDAGAETRIDVGFWHKLLNGQDHTRNALDLVRMSVHNIIDDKNIVDYKEQLPLKL